MSHVPPQQNPVPPRPNSDSGTAVATAAAGGGIAIAIIAIVAVLLLVSLCVIGVLVALLLPAIQSARDAARTVQSSNNMRQIGLAMHNYQSTHGEFPPAYTEDNSGQRLQSWRTLILPYLEQANLYEMVNMDQPWNAPANIAVSDTRLPMYVSPRFGDENETFTNYVVITGPGTMFDGANGAKMWDVKDGTTNTILAIEVANSDVHWAEPRDLEINSLQLVTEGAPSDAPLVIPRRANVLMADGSVHRLDGPISAEMLRKLSTIADGEAVSLP